jgi:hypothetical protein
MHQYDDGWGDSPEWRLMEEVSVAVMPVLDKTKLDAQSREIIWNDKKRYSLEATIMRLQGMFSQYPPEYVESEVLDWLENQVAPPNVKTRKAELRFERRMENWLADYRKSSNPEAITVR